MNIRDSLKTDSALVLKSCQTDPETGVNTGIPDLVPRWDSLNDGPLERLENRNFRWYRFKNCPIVQLPVEKKGLSATPEFIFQLSTLEIEPWDTGYDLMELAFELSGENTRDHFANFCEKYGPLGKPLRVGSHYEYLEDLTLWSVHSVYLNDVFVVADAVRREDWESLSKLRLLSERSAGRIVSDSYEALGSRMCPPKKLQDDPIRERAWRYLHESVAYWIQAPATGFFPRLGIRGSSLIEQIWITVGLNLESSQIGRCENPSCAKKWWVARGRSKSGAIPKKFCSDACRQRSHRAALRQPIASSLSQ